MKILFVSSRKLGSCAGFTVWPCRYTRNQPLPASTDHPSWCAEEVEDVLVKHGADFVWVECAQRVPLGKRSIVFQVNGAAPDGASKGHEVEAFSCQLKVRDCDFVRFEAGDGLASQRSVVSAAVLIVKEEHVVTIEAAPQNWRPDARVSCTAEQAKIGKCPDCLETTLQCQGKR